MSELGSGFVKAQLVNVIMHVLTIKFRGVTSTPKTRNMPHESSIDETCVDSSNYAKTKPSSTLAIAAVEESNSTPQRSYGMTWLRGIGPPDTVTYFGYLICVI